MGILAPLPLEASQLIRVYNRVLQTETQLDDPLEWIPNAVYSTTKKVAIPNACELKLDGDKNARFEQWGMINDLVNEPTEGSTAAQNGAEERLQTKYSVAYSNDVSHAVTLEEYGIEALAKEGYKINEQAIAKLNTWKSQLIGRYKRNALLETISYNLAQNPHNLNVIFNPNFYICGVSNGNQPVYADNTAAAWANMIVNSMITSAGGATAAGTMRYFIKLEHYASVQKYIRPVDVGGKETYIVLVPSPTANYLKDPSVTAAIGANFTARSALNEAEMNFPMVLGRIGRLLLLEDPRYPTLTVGGSAGNYSLTARYRGMGRGPLSDPRDFTQNAALCGFLLGQGAYWNKTDEPWHIEYQWDPYDKAYGMGPFATLGYGTPRYQIGTQAAATNIQQDSSIVLLFGQPPANWL